MPRTRSRFLFWLGLTLLLGGCTSLGSGLNSQPIPALAPVMTDHPLYRAPHNFSRSAAPLVARYYRIEQEDRLEYWGLSYKPRQSRLAGFEGWDILDMPDWLRGENRSDWLRIHLNRPARVAVVWERNELWLAGWNRSSITVEGKPQNVFTKDFPAGEIALGSPGNAGSQGYFVLLAEQGGQPSSEPPLPAGIAAGERPLPNQECPSWLENAWTLQGLHGSTAPDGHDYKTWHPQIDPIYWCYYAHDHGSDPALVGYKPAFGYVAKFFNGQAELHVGFKGFAIRQEDTGLGWYVNIHSETGVVSRACARFHTVVVAVTNLRTGELLAELGYKGDFGATLSNQGNNPPLNLTCLNPRTNQQESQAQIATQTEASKRLRVFSGDSDPGGYEQWDGGLKKSLGMSFGGQGMGIDIRNPATGCNDANCAAAKVTGSEADRRTIHFDSLKVRYTREIEAMDLRDGRRDGEFWTDLYGDPLPPDKRPGDPGTIRQFIKPGFESAGANSRGLSGFYTTQDAWRAVYMPDGHVPGLNLEEGLGSLN